MYRIEAAAFLLAFLPLAMAILFRSAVVPRRKDELMGLLQSAERRDQSNYVQKGEDQVKKDFDSQYSSRLMFPASLVSVLYAIGFSLGILVLMKDYNASCPVWFCGSLNCISYEHLRDPIAALIGAYVFNLGVLVRRGFVADLTKNVYWSSVNRLIFSVGIAIAISWAPDSAKAWGLFLSFSVAFVPNIFLTWIKKTARGQLSVSDSPVQELDIQLVQGIDVWKEERLEEEGIESVQNLATADALSLAVKTHYPLRTILDWIDQAILIQRYPTKLKQLQDSGLAMSAIELCRIESDQQGALIQAIAEKLQVDPQILEYSIQAMYEDAAIQNIWDLWQSKDANSHG
jgi:hypothetical protein